MEIVRFQGEQNKQLQRNSNGFHVNFFPQSHDPAEISWIFNEGFWRPEPDDLIIVCLLSAGVDERAPKPCASVTVSGSDQKESH